MRKPVGVKRHDGSANNNEKTEANPGRDQGPEASPGKWTARALRTGERINDAAKQDRLGELRGCECDIRQSKRPAQTNLRTEKPEDARVKPKNRHQSLCAASLGATT